MAKIGKVKDKSEWGMTPQTINAYYNPLQNEIVFPARFCNRRSLIRRLIWPPTTAVSAR
jgi:hypothetical protein